MPPAAAYFDVDGTIARTNIIRYYVHFRTRGLHPALRGPWMLGYLPQAFRWLVLDAVDRSRMNRSFYRSYAGMDAAALRALAAKDYPALLGRHVFPAARRRIEEHRARGEAVVLVTGSLDFIVAPLAADLGADRVLAVSMAVEDGMLTGELTSPPIGGAEKARLVTEHGRENGVDLGASWAYGDSIADVPVLSTVGHAVAVNPDRGLAVEAGRRGWPIERWTVEEGEGRR